MRQRWKRLMEWLEWHRTSRLRFKALTAAYGKACSRCANAEAEAARLRSCLAEADDLRAGLKRELKDALAECARTEARCDALESGKTTSGLTPAEVERLALLAMAAGKLAAEAGKVVLFGWAQAAPKTGRPTYADVEHGLGRVSALTSILIDAGDVRGGDVRAHARRAIERIGEQTNWQQSGEGEK